MTSTRTPATGRRHRVVIIGSGFGGLFAARTLDRANVDVTLISRTAHHLFQPLLYQVATGILSVGEIAPNTRVILRDQENIRTILGDAYDIDLENRTVTSKLTTKVTVTPYDSLIVAAGAHQSYFGNDHFARYAPGMKTIDDALELRGRILGAFEQAEVSEDPEEQRRLITFVIVGAGPTGVEMAGQVAEMATRTLKGAFRNIDPGTARVILIDGAPQVLPPFGESLGRKAQERLEKLGVEVHLNAMVSDVDASGIVVRDKEGNERRIESTCKIWSAGVQASSLGALIARRSDAETDRAGRVQVLPDLTIPGHPEVFVIGDMMSLDNLPGVAQVAMQGGKYAARQILSGLDGQAPEERKPFKYFDKGSMATVSRFSAVVKVGKFEISGFIGWLMWLIVHLMYLIGFKNRITTMFSWGVNILTQSRSQLTATDQQVFGRAAMAKVQAEREARRKNPGAAEDAEG